MRRLLVCLGARGTQLLAGRGRATLRTEQLLALLSRILRPPLGWSRHRRVAWTPHHIHTRARARALLFLAEDAAPRTHRILGLRDFLPLLGFEREARGIAPPLGGALRFVRSVPAHPTRAKMPRARSSWADGKR